MAITQVRAQINGTWYTLALDSATGKYFVDLTLTASSINQPGGYFPATVEASGNDAPTVTLSGTSYPGLRLVVKDATAPILTVTAPANGLVTAADSVTVSGTAIDAYGISSVKINGTAVTVAANGSFSATVSLSVGSNTITVVATDKSGNTATQTRTVILDTAPPVIALTAPTAGQMVRTAAFTVAGTVSDERLSGVTVNGAAATVSNGVFSKGITLAEGANAIIAIASDAAGNTAAAYGSVLLDTIPPALTVTSPAGDMITNQPQTITVTGTASDSGSGLASVKVNGTAVTLTGGAYSKSITLTEGANPITVTATDKAGNVTTVTRSVLLDTAPPVLALVSPPAGFLNTATPTVVFSVADPPGGSGVDLSTVAVYVDGAAHAAAISAGTITITPTLADGVHVITVTVEDIAGNQRGLSAAYTVDTVPPELYITAPYMRHVVDDASVEISAQAHDVGTGVASVTAGGYPLTGEGLYRGTVPLAVGENTITVTASDYAGNQTSAQVYMIRLITDRTQADVKALENLYAKLQGGVLWTQAEREWFLSGVARGAYNAEDLNRVGMAVQWLAGELERRGFPAAVQAKTDWAQADAPTQSQMRLYLRNVETVRSAQRLYVSDIPRTMIKSGVGDWNKIEKALVETDAYFPNYVSWTAGEISAGGY